MPLPPSAASARPASRRRAASSPTMRPSRKTRMRVDRFSTSGSSLEMSRIAGARRRELVDERVDLRLRADVHAARRLVEDQDAALRREPFRQHDLLLVAARQRRRPARRAPARARAGARSTADAAPRSARAVMNAERASRAQNRQRRVVERAHRRAPGPAACDPRARGRCRARIASAGRVACRAAARDRDVARRVADRGRTAPARPRSGRRRPARRSPTTSPARSVNETSAKLAGLDRPSTRSSSSPGVARRRAPESTPRAGGRSSSATSVASVELGDRPRGHVPAVAQHGDRVAQPEDLLHPVADVDARHAALAQPADQLVEPLGLVLRQAARRLVEDDDRARRCRPPPRSAASAAAPIVSSPTGGRRRASAPIAASIAVARAAASRARETKPAACGQRRRDRGSRRPTGSRRTRAPGGPCRRRPRARRAGCDEA